jgi:hypothetical protein
MALEKQTVIDLIEVVESGVVQVRTKTKIVEDGNELSASFSRNTITPGEDYSAQDERVQAICAAVHTAEVIESYKLAQSYNSNVMI